MPPPCHGVNTPFYTPIATASVTMAYVAGVALGAKSRFGGLFFSDAAIRRFYFDFKYAAISARMT